MSKLLSSLDIAKLLGVSRCFFRYHEGKKNPALPKPVSILREKMYLYSEDQLPQFKKFIELSPVERVKELVVKKDKQG